jgi:hypothetical protein
MFEMVVFWNKPALTSFKTSTALTNLPTAPPMADKWSSLNFCSVKSPLQYLTTFPTLVSNPILISLLGLLLVGLVFDWSIT